VCVCVCVCESECTVAAWHSFALFPASPWQILHNAQESQSPTECVCPDYQTGPEDGKQRTGRGVGEGRQEKTHFRHQKISFERNSAFCDILVLFPFDVNCSSINIMANAVNWDFKMMLLGWSDPKWTVLRAFVYTWYSCASLLAIRRLLQLNMQMNAWPISNTVSCGGHQQVCKANAKSAMFFEMNTSKNPSKVSLYHRQEK